mmetsp:Transcript_8998/g.16321  ORF Transcript_8998/g.16321 Transcript_8998/m.16321 type:complete len:140 (-) Transcript_8998:67-486(-)|eukprot:CAMPEP_0182493622 /NCGR_PEP_ID=MMETSP1321-20130603/2562_1 /TAXON_ID=91990 /ORGANISM="Bolidomonas sp., Strain RCC1657" /LENGTH=139 /DNA_ID=CAMNT_0024696441 /DNA_START=170 /DNA_END=589 /DNA_ORIENTATION=+
MLSSSLLRPLLRTSLRPLSTTVTKTSTGLVGLPVHPDPVPSLKSLNESILQSLDRLPPCGYKSNALQIANFRLKTIAESEGSVDHIEAEIDCGQIEELIIQAQDELKVVDMYYENKLWESIHVPEEEFVEAKKVEEGEA